MKQTNYREGFKDGYCEGWKFIRGEHAPCPPSPPCPPPRGVDTYKMGYNTGFKAGIKKAKSKIC